MCENETIPKTIYGADYENRQNDANIQSIASYGQNGDSSPSAYVPATFDERKDVPTNLGHNKHSKEIINKQQQTIIQLEHEKEAYRKTAYGLLVRNISENEPEETWSELQELPPQDEHLIEELLNENERLKQQKKARDAKISYLNQECSELRERIVDKKAQTAQSLSLKRKQQLTKVKPSDPRCKYCSELKSHCMEQCECDNKRARTSVPRRVADTSYGNFSIDTNISFEFKKDVPTLNKKNNINLMKCE